MSARETVQDLMGALEASVAAAKQRRLDRQTSEIPDRLRVWTGANVRDQLPEHLMLAAEDAAALIDSQAAELVGLRESAKHGELMARAVIELVDEKAVLEAELVGLREQIARQAPVIEAARKWADWLDDYDDSVGRPRRWDDDLYVAVRALSVPAPPEAPTVDAVHRWCSHCYGEPCHLDAAPPPTEEEAQR